eukprot:10336619-Alexandrium_andersonii.AAC.1
MARAWTVATSGASAVPAAKPRPPFIATGLPLEGARRGPSAAPASLAALHSPAGMRRPPTPVLGAGPA